MGITGPAAVIGFLAMLVALFFTQQTMEDLRRRQELQADAMFEQLELYSRAASQCLNSPSSPANLSTVGQSVTIAVAQLVACNTLGAGWSDTSALGGAVTMTATLTSSGKPRVSIDAKVPATWLPAVQSEAPLFDLADAGISVEAQNGNTLPISTAGVAPTTPTLSGDAASPGYDAQAAFGQ